MPTYDSLQHVFLIAMPQMTDPLFARSVVYLWEYNERGALGVIINKPMKTQLGDLLGQLNIPVVDPIAATFPVLHGGPVAMDQGFIIRRQHHVEQDSGKPMVEITVSSSKQDLVKLANGQGLEDTLVMVGCAGWDAGQLDEEITKKNDWLIVPFSESTLFAEDKEDEPTDWSSRAAGKWMDAAARAGIDLKRLSSDFGHA